METVEYLLNEAKKKHDKIKDLLDLTNPLVGKTCKRTTTYMMYLEATCRRNYYSLFSLYHLSDLQLVWFGSAALDLSRQMIEDMVSIEWMELKGPEEQAKKLKKFQAVEIYNNLEQSRRLGVEPKSIISPKLVKKLEADFNNIKPVFSKKKENGEFELFHTYNYQSVETMITEIDGKINPSILTSDDLSRIKYWYIEGNKKNHFNGDDILSYLDSENERDAQMARQLERALFIGINTFTQICLRYLDEMQKDDGGIPNISKIREDIILLVKSD